MQYRGIIGAVLAVGLIAAPAFAGPLGPKKPSQIVTLRCFTAGTSCTIDGSGGGQVETDGTFLNTGYTVPVGKVLVVTSVEIRPVGTTGTTDNVRFQYGPASTQVMWEVVTYSSISTASVHREFPTGIVFTPAAVAAGLRFSSDSAASIAGNVNGYITTDK